VFCFRRRPQPSSSLFPYTTLFRSWLLTLTQRVPRSVGRGRCCPRDSARCLSYQRSGSFLLRTTALGKRNYLETRERALPRHVSAGDNGRGLRVSRLRRRWLDGHLPGE